MEQSLFDGTSTAYYTFMRVYVLIIGGQCPKSTYEWGSLGGLIASLTGCAPEILF